VARSIVFPGCQAHSSGLLSVCFAAMKITLSLWVDEEIKRKAKALAKARGISVSQLFSDLIDRESKKLEKKPRRQ